MQKKHVLMIYMICFLLFLTACNIIESSETNITIIHGENEITTMGLVEFRFKGMPEISKEHHVFLGWYKDKAYTQRFYEDETISSNLTIYARWVNLLDFDVSIKESSIENQRLSVNLVIRCQSDAGNYIEIDLIENQEVINRQSFDFDYSNILFNYNHIEDTKQYGMKVYAVFLNERILLDEIDFGFKTSNAFQEDPYENHESVYKLSSYEFEASENNEDDEEDDVLAVWISLGMFVLSFIIIRISRKKWKKKQLEEESRASENTQL